MRAIAGDRDKSWDKDSDNNKDWDGDKDKDKAEGRSYTRSIEYKRSGAECREDRSELCLYSESAARPVSSNACAHTRARHCPSISAPPDISNNCAYQPRTPSYECTYVRTHARTHARTHQPSDSVYALTGATLHRVPPYLLRRTTTSPSLGGDVAQRRRRSEGIVRWRRCHVGLSHGCRSIYDSTPLLKVVAPRRLHYPAA